MEKLSNISAISKSKEIWGDFYDYSTFSYVNARTPIELICVIKYDDDINDKLNFLYE